MRLGKFTPGMCALPSTLLPLQDPSVKLLQLANDTIVIGLIQDSDESALRREVNQLAPHRLVNLCGLLADLVAANSANSRVKENRLAVLHF